MLPASSMRKRRLSILLLSRAFYPPDKGGVGTHAHYLSIALKTSFPYNYFHVLTTGTSNAVEGTPPNLKVHRLAKDVWNPSIGGASSVPVEGPLRYLQDNWSQIRADVIHAHDFESLQVALMLYGAFGTPIVFTVHKAPKEWDPSQPKRDPRDCFLALIKSLRAPIILVAPSRAYRARLLSQGFNSQAIEQIPHGVAISDLIAIGNHPQIIERYEIQPEHRVIFCPSRLDRHKGIDTLIDAAHLVLNQASNQRLCFVVAGLGEPDYRVRLEHQADILGIQNSMRLGPSRGPEPELVEMPTLYRRSDICVVPSRREGFGQVILEAFAFKVPVVASNTGGIPDIIDGEDCGLLFHRDEPQDLANALLRLLREPNLRENLAANAYRKLSMQYSAPTMAKSYMALYRRASELRR